MTNTESHPIRSIAVLPDADRLVYTVAEVGELPAIRLGRRRLVPKMALQALLTIEGTSDNSTDGAAAVPSPAST